MGYEQSRIDPDKSAEIAVIIAHMLLWPFMILLFFRLTYRNLRRLERFV